MCQVFTVHLGTVPTVVVADITILKELLARFVIVTNSPNHYRREANYLDLGRRPLLWHDPHLIKPLLIIENLVHIVWGKKQPDPAFRREVVGRAPLYLTHGIMQVLTYKRDDDDDDDDDDDSGDDDQFIDIPPGPGLDLQRGRPLERAAQMDWSGAQVIFF